MKGVWTSGNAFRSPSIPIAQMSLLFRAVQKRMYRPSGDQSVDSIPVLLIVEDCNSRFGIPPAASGFSYRSALTENARRLPSGDHTGKNSAVGSVVKRVTTPRVVSSNQISVLLATVR